MRHLIAGNFLLAFRACFLQLVNFANIITLDRSLFGKTIQRIFFTHALHNLSIPIKESYGLLRHYVNNDPDAAAGAFLRQKEIFRQRETLPSVCVCVCVCLPSVSHFSFFRLPFLIFASGFHLYMFIVIPRDAFFIIYT